MPNKMSGPHFCMGTARNIADKIFRELTRKAQLSGGTLTLSDIEKLSESFNDKIAGNTQVFERVYNECVSTHQGSASRMFNRKTLPGFVVFAYTVDVMKGAFPSQGARSGKGWYTHLADALIVYAKDRLDIDIPATVNAAYDRMSVERGQAMTIDDVVKAAEVAEIIGKFIVQLRGATNDGADTEKMSTAINDQLRADLKLVGASTLLVNNVQTRDFVRRLEAEKYANPYRKAIYLAEATCQKCA
ncbi:MAG: hypothetical protein R3D02_12200 [Hyphomicrobiales bacterium]